MSDANCKVIQGDCLEVLPTLPANSFDAIVTDAPYGLEFMGKGWDGAVPGVLFWDAMRHALKPGGYMLAFGGTRTQHRLACAIEDAGFEIRDCLLWLYGTGFPKGQGCLKPAYEPILLARKPGLRVLPLGIDECRVGTETIRSSGAKPGKGTFAGNPDSTGSHIWNGQVPSDHVGRYPANILHDGSDEVLEAFAAFGPAGSNSLAPGSHSQGRVGFRSFGGQGGPTHDTRDSGTAARFFYTAKASKAERGEGNTHPTVKPLALMQWLVRLACPPGGTVLDPFGGSGTTGLAAIAEGRSAILIEREPAYCDIIRKRLAGAQGPLFAEAM